MRFNSFKKFGIVGTWGMVIVGGLGVGSWSYLLKEQALHAELIEAVKSAAVRFDRSEVRVLSGSRHDLTEPGFIAIKSRLSALVGNDPRARSMLIFRVGSALSKGTVLAYSSGLGMRDEPQPGDTYSAALTLPGVRRTLGLGGPASDGPWLGEVGAPVMAYAVIGGTREGGAGAAVVDVLRLERDASDWRGLLWQTGVAVTLAGWMVLGLLAWALLMFFRLRGQREAIRNLAEALEQTSSALMVVARDYSVEYVNRGLCEQLGYTRRELIGRDCRDLHSADNAPELLADISSTLRAGRPWRGEWINQRSGGDRYQARGAVVPVNGRNGEVSCFVAVFEDMTGQIAKEGQLRDALQLARAADRAKGQFLATMSHEVRTPLNGIAGFSSLLLETSLSDEQREYVETIRMSTDALTQLTGDILDITRIESGNLALDPVDCDIRECLEDVLDLFATKAVEKKIELVHEIDPLIPATLSLDVGRLRQILVNLIGNAVKFTVEGEVSVSVRLVAEAALTVQKSLTPQPLCRLEWTVRDTGIGIAEQHHGKLFKPFSQVDDSTTRRFGGTGLGLAICRNLVELMGGGIQLESQAGQGATFRFSVQGVVIAPAPAKLSLQGMRLGLVVQSGSLRGELRGILESWSVVVTEVVTLKQLASASCDFALVEVAAGREAEWIGQTPLTELTSDRVVGIVPLSLPSGVRAELREHFGFLVNKPVHHGALFNLLVASRASVSPFLTAVVAPVRLGLRVLVVEDNLANQRLIQRVLLRLGCTSHLAVNGREALEYLERSSDATDVVLLDLHMPEMDGITALKEIRRGAAGVAAQSIWIVALTADVRVSAQEEGIAAGLNDYLTKPLVLPALERALQRFINMRSARLMGKGS